MRTFIESVSDLAAVIFLVSVLVHLLLIIRFSRQIRAESGNHFQIAFRISKREGALGKVFFGSFLLIVCCFAWWVFSAILNRSFGG